MCTTVVDEKLSCWCGAPEDFRLLTLDGVESSHCQRCASMICRVADWIHSCTPVLTAETAARLAVRRKLVLDAWPGHDDAVFSCDNCFEADRCDWAFDVYNTNGDCIAMK